MPQYESPFLTYQPGGLKQVVDTLVAADTTVCDTVASESFIHVFGGTINPMPRVAYDVMEGWNLVVLGLLLLLVVMNKQLFPRQFRQILSVPNGVAQTNQLLREWSPVGSFLGFTFTLAYLIIMALFVQKSCVVLSRDAAQYNSTGMFFAFFGAVTGWVLLRHLFLYYVNWIFDARDTVNRQMTVQLSVSIYSFLMMIPVLLLLLYNPYSLFVWIGIGLISAAALMRFVLEILETRVTIKHAPFFIFLYFCGLEIAPTAMLLTASLRYFSQGSVF
jgi:hypothetical protein